LLFKLLGLFHRVFPNNIRKHENTRKQSMPVVFLILDKLLIKKIFILPCIIEHLYYRAIYLNARISNSLIYINFSSLKLFSFKNYYNFILILGFLSRNDFRHLLLMDVTVRLGYPIYFIKYTTSFLSPQVFSLGTWNG